MHHLRIRSPFNSPISLSYQTLERRDLLAGNVSVDFQGDTLTIRGDNQDNQISIESTATGVRVSGQATSINRANITNLEFSQVPSRLFVDLKSGNNTFSAANIHLAKDFQFTSRGGNDSLWAENSTFANQKVNFGSGNNLLEMKSVTIWNKLQIVGSSGDDVVCLEDVHVGGQLKFRLSRGDDTFVSSKLSVDGKMNANMGGGNDQCLLNGQTQVDSKAKLILGSGDDFLAITPERMGTTAEIGKMLQVQCGSGNDVVSLDAQLQAEQVRLQGGAGQQDHLSDGQINPADSRGFNVHEPKKWTSRVQGLYADLASRGVDPVPFGQTVLQLDTVSQQVKVTDPTPTLSVIWDQAVQTAVTNKRSGPTVASRAYAVLHTAMFDAWSAYDVAASSTTSDDRWQRPVEENTTANKTQAMSFAAYRVLIDLFPDQVAVFDSVMTRLGYNGNNQSVDVTTPVGIGNTLAAKLLEVRHADGSNQLGNNPASNGNPYSDTSDYQPANAVGQRDFVDRWTPETVPIDADPLQNPPSQVYLTPHWGSVQPFGMNSGNQFRPAAPEPFLLVPGTVDVAAKTITTSDNVVHDIDRSLIGTLINPRFIDQVEEIVSVSADLTDEQKLIAEFWEDGGGTSFPPGTWMTFAAYVSARDDHSLDEDAKMFFAVSNALMDAGIATWEAKGHYDYARPVRAIRTLGELELIGTFDAALGGYAIESWKPGSGTTKQLASEFLTYQTPNRDPSPPFAEYTSGHSAFSAAGAAILELFTESTEFGAHITFSPGSSRFEPNVTPDIPLTLTWPTFRAAADEAGFSRRYGGIHFADGDIQGRELGRKVAQAVWDKAFAYFGTDA